MEPYVITRSNDKYYLKSQQEEYLLADLGCNLRDASSAFYQAQLEQLFREAGKKYDSALPRCELPDLLCILGAMFEHLLRRPFCACRVLRLDPEEDCLTPILFQTLQIFSPCPLILRWGAEDGSGPGAGNLQLLRNESFDLILIGKGEKTLSGDTVENLTRVAAPGCLLLHCRAKGTDDQGEDFSENQKVNSAQGPVPDGFFARGWRRLIPVASVWAKVTPSKTEAFAFRKNQEEEDFIRKLLQTCELVEKEVPAGAEANGLRVGGALRQMETALSGCGREKELRTVKYLAVEATERQLDLLQAEEQQPGKSEICRHDVKRLAGQIKARLESFLSL